MSTVLCISLETTVVRFTSHIWSKITSIPPPSPESRVTDFREVKRTVLSVAGMKWSQEESRFRFRSATLYPWMIFFCLARNVSYVTMPITTLEKNWKKLKSIHTVCRNVRKCRFYLFCFLDYQMKLWSIYKLKQGLWCTIWLSYIIIYIRVFQTK